MMNKLYNTMMQIFNSDKEGGFTSKELGEIFGKNMKKKDILSLNYQTILELVDIWKEKKTIRIGDVVKIKPFGDLGVCIGRKDDNSINVLLPNGDMLFGESDFIKVYSQAVDIKGFMNLVKEACIETMPVKEMMQTKPKMTFKKGQYVTAADPSCCDIIIGIVDADKEVEGDTENIAVRILKHRKKEFAPYYSVWVQAICCGEPRLRIITDEEAKTILKKYSKE